MADNTNERRADTHPADLHPCEHGDAIVASAVAEVRFTDAACNTVIAWIGDELFADMDKDVGRWLLRLDWNGCLFHPITGLRLPTTAELAQMYEKWMAEKEQRNG